MSGLQKGDTPSLTITKKMMQDYRISMPVLESSQIAVTHWLESGLSIFTIGSDGYVNYFVRDPESQTGWSFQKLSFQASNLCSYTDSDGKERVYATSKTATGSYITGEIVETESGCVLDKHCSVSFEYLTAARYLQETVFLGANSSVTPHWLMSSRTGQDRFAVVFDDPAAESGTGQVIATKAILLPPETPETGWPHVRFVSLNGGKISFYRGINSDLFLHVTNIPLPIMKSIIDFDVVTDNGSILIVAVDRSDRFYTLQQKSDGTWEEWQTHDLTGIANPSFTRVRCLQLSDGSLDVIATDLYGKVWSTSRTNGEWTVFVALGLSASNIDFSKNELGLSDFVAATADRGLTYGSRDTSRDWRLEQIELDVEVHAKPIHVYSVGLVFTDEFHVNIPSIDLSITASEFVPAVINGNASWIGPLQETHVSTDEKGALNLQIEINNSLYTPALTFSGAALDGGSLVLRPDADVQNYLGKLTSQDLLSGNDPLSGQQVITGVYRTDQDVEHVRQTLARICEVAEHLYAPGPEVKIKKLHIPSMRGVRYYPAGDAVRLNRLDPSRLQGKPWRFSMRTGRPVFTELTREEADECLRNARAQENQSDWLGVDWGSAWESFTEGINKIVEITMNAASVVLTAFLDGIERTLVFVIENLQQVFDLVLGVFDAIGTLLGTVVGWLLSVIGFLFGWDKIKETRDDLKQLVRESFLKVSENLPDPISLKADVYSWLTDIRQNAKDWAAKMDSTVFGKAPFLSSIGIAPPSTSWFDLGDVDLFQPGTWLLQKIQEYLLKFTGTVDPPQIPGLKEVLEPLTNKLDSSYDSQRIMVDAIWEGTFNKWINNIGSFEEDSVQPFGAFLVNFANPLVDFLQMVVDDALQLAHLCYENPQAILDWLDAPLYVPFLSSFYKQVLGNDFSLLDAFCLLAAVVVVIRNAAGRQPNETDPRAGTFGMLIMHVLMRAIAESSRAIYGGTQDPVLRKRVMQVTTAANGVLLAAALINLLRSPKREWYFFAGIAGGNFVLDFLFTMAGHFGIYSTPNALQRRNFAGFKVLSGIAGLAILLSLELKEEDQDWGAMASSLLVSLSLSLNGAISMMPERRPVPVVIGYTAAQSCFALSYPILFANFGMEKSSR